MAFAEKTKTKAEMLDFLTRTMGKKIGKSKLYKDLKAAKIPVESGGYVTRESLVAYAHGLEDLAPSATKTGKASELSERKQLADIKRIEEQGRREELKRMKEEGLLIPREEVHIELAARAVALKRELNNSFKQKGLDLVYLVGGEPDKSQELMQACEKLVNEALGEYARLIVLEVQLNVDDEESFDDAEEDEEEAEGY